jgi:hypothetical protein
MLRFRLGGAASLLAVLVAAPLHGQDRADRPQGWVVRPDMPSADVEDVFFVDMPPGWHVTTGPAVILYHPEQRATGTYRVEMDVYLFDPKGRREAFGFFTGGMDLESDDQRYTYWLLREGGQFLVKRRQGTETAVVTDWTDHEAIKAFADVEEGDASTLNEIVLEAGAETVRLLVNDREVASLPRAGLDLDGVVGLRINHGLNVHVSRLDVIPTG